MQNWFVVVMGVCTAFVVLILIIGMCYLLAMLCREKEKKTEEPSVQAAPEATIPNRPELVAALSVAIAEYSGTDASAIRILSIKKI